MALGMPAAWVLVGALASLRACTSLPLRQPEACACLKWREVYSSGMARCGEGLEQYTYSKAVGITNMSNYHWCDGVALYPRQSDGYCTKVWQASVLPPSPASFADGTWCYVSATCADLHGGGGINSQVSWKSCLRGSDKLLADLRPPELIAYSQANGIDLGLLVQMAYPVLKGRVWRDVREFWLNGTAVSSGLVLEGQSTIICENKVPRHIAKYDPCGGGEVFVAVGTEVWRMDSMVCRTGDKGCKPYAS